MKIDKYDKLVEAAIRQFSLLQEGRTALNLSSSHWQD